MLKSGLRCSRPASSKAANAYTVATPHLVKEMATLSALVVSILWSEATPRTAIYIEEKKKPKAGEEGFLYTSVVRYISVWDYGPRDDGVGNIMIRLSPTQWPISDLRMAICCFAAGESSVFPCSAD
jgi:hypothetical protein